MSKKERLKNLSAKHICENIDIKYRPISDSFKHKNKLSITLTDRKKVITEVEKTLEELRKIYEL